MVHEQLVVGGLLDRAGDPLPVFRAEDERPQDEHVECALHQDEAVTIFSGRHLTQGCAFLGQMSTRAAAQGRARHASL